MLKSTDGQVYLRRSGPDAALEVLPRDFSGGYSITSQHEDGIELRLGNVHDGYMVVGQERRELPVGSILDPETGIFYWATSAPLLGDYELRFVPDDETAEPVRVYVKIVPQQFGVRTARQ